MPGTEVSMSFSFFLLLSCIQLEEKGAEPDKKRSYHYEKASKQKMGRLLMDFFSDNLKKRKSQQLAQCVSDDNPYQKQGSPTPFFPCWRGDFPGNQVLQKKEKAEKRDAAACIGHGDGLVVPEERCSLVVHWYHEKAQKQG